MQEPSPRYTGYTSFDYLEPHADYRVFALATEFDRVPSYDLGLDEEQTVRVTRILHDEHAISLHEHPKILTADPYELREYNHTGRNAMGFAGLARSGMSAYFDNFMNGTNCVTSESGWKWNDVIFDIGLRFADVAQQDHVVLARTVADLEKAKATGRIALVAGLEAATAIENELDRLDILYGLGIRQIGIAYSMANQLGSGLAEPTDGGLTNFGRRAVERMNKLGLAIDISHSSDRTSREVVEASSVPIFITHAGARAVWPTNRMKPDDVIVACAERGGVIGIEAAPHTTLSAEHPEHSLESVMDHFRYCVDLVGIDHVAFGPDTNFGDHVGLHDSFSGHLTIQQAHGHVEHPRVPYVAGMENPAENFTNIVGWLVKNGYSDEDIRKVIGTNVLRVLREVW
ncbi:MULTISPECIES: dipeptidase [unclassified Microbacterium]|uniref:dipeptidase n=1 Tax=unclassified Microbacterium TaxID=2609290 RepID=UPI00214AC476|nr:MULTISPECIES: dipeptidase [unclassified Microbacterium]MCR2783215.1 dipeptidase [Microbacterium sp. zg.B96]WIM15906.1 dipeptidase [Microbacterium sp. zg-B96]